MYLIKKISGNLTLRIISIYGVYYMVGALFLFVTMQSGDYFKQKNFLIPDVLNIIASTYLFYLIFLVLPLLTSGFAALLSHFFFRPFRDGFIYSFLLSILVFFLFNLSIFIQKFL